MAGLYPEDPFEAALADIAVDAVNDCQLKLRPTMEEKDPEKKVRLAPRLSPRLHIPSSRPLES